MIGWYGGGMGPLEWLGISMFVLIALALVGWLVVRLLPSGPGGTTRHTAQSPLGILDRRLACGQIHLQAWQASRAALVGAQGQWR
jgi:putative membrane protein